jgi:hypothetical protein
MLRTALAIILIAILAVGVWYGARWFAGRDDLHVTVVFESAGELRQGDPVTTAGLVIGRVVRVASLETQDAVSIVVEAQHRKELMRDSLFSIEEEGDGARLEVINSVAVGPPLADGAVVYARDDRVSRWIAKHGDELGAALGKLKGQAGKLIEKYESGELQDELERYKRQAPEWRRQGDEVLRRNLGNIEKKVDDMEKALREHNRVKEADELRRRFEEWRNGLKAEPYPENERP